MVAGQSPHSEVSGAADLCVPLSPAFLDTKPSPQWPPDGCAEKPPQQSSCRLTYPMSLRETLASSQTGSACPFRAKETTSACPSRSPSTPVCPMLYSHTGLQHAPLWTVGLRPLQKWTDDSSTPLTLQLFSSRGWLHLLSRHLVRALTASSWWQLLAT